MDKPLEDKGAVVIGGSRGLGKGIVARLVGDGAVVVIGFHERADLARAVMAEAAHGRAYAVGADPSSVDNTVSPGLVETEELSDTVEPEVLRRWRRGNGFARLAQPRDIADVVGFLVGSDARWITGRTCRPPEGPCDGSGSSRPGRPCARRAVGEPDRESAEANPDRYRVFTQTGFDARRKHGIDAELLDALPASGLPHVAGGQGPRYDEPDLANGALLGAGLTAADGDARLVGGHPLGRTRIADHVRRDRGAQLPEERPPGALFGRARPPTA